MSTLFMRHAETGGESEFPDEPGVREFYEARGWTVEEKPAPAPFIAAPGNIPAGDNGFVQLYHPELVTTHLFPDNPDAVAGAKDAGWIVPIPAPDPTPAGDEPPSETPEPDPVPKTSKRRASASADSEKENG